MAFGRVHARVSVCRLFLFSRSLRKRGLHRTCCLAPSLDAFWWLYGLWSSIAHFSHSHISVSFSSDRRHFYSNALHIAATLEFGLEEKYINTNCTLTVHLFAFHVRSTSKINGLLRKKNVKRQLKVMQTLPGSDFRPFHENSGNIVVCTMCSVCAVCPVLGKTTAIERCRLWELCWVSQLN